jgi:hypothetical protein
MSISVRDYIDVEERASELGCAVPTAIAIMPENFEWAPSRDYLHVRAEGATVQTLLRNFDYPVASLRPPGERSISIHNKSIDWQATIFVAASLISENPDLPSMMLELIKRYLGEVFKADPSKGVKLTVITEKTSKRVFKQITYEGDIAGLTTLKDAICDVVRD